LTSAHHAFIWLAMKPLVSLRDIAREAGVHYTTVSLALRNDPRLPIHTRERIQQIAVRLGYHSNPLVSSLISNLKRARLPPEVGVIGFLDTLSRPSGPFRRSPQGHPFYEGALQRAGELGYKMDLFQLHSAGMTSRRMASILKTRAIRGIVIDSHLFPRGHLSMNISHFACVMRGYSNLLPKVHRVSHNHFQGILCAIHSLRHFGYRKIGLALNESTDTLVNNQWTAGYLTYQRRLPLSQRVPFLLFRDLTPEKMRQWIHRHRPGAILGLRPVFELITLAGFSVPAEIGFADLDLDATPDQGHAGIWQHMDRMGSIAVDLVTAQMQRNEYGLPPNPQLTLVEGVWRNGSTAVK
jgi:LacI family transcriptional regulator